MTYKELLSIVRGELDDVLEPFMWSDSELQRYLLLSLQQAFSDTKTYEKTFEDITIQADSEYFQCTDEVLFIKENEVEFDNNSLFLEDPTILRRYKTLSGPPRWYYHVPESNLLYLVPSPDEDGTLTFTATCTLVDISDLSKPMLGNPRYHLYYVDGVMARAYLKQDSQTYNPQQSKLHYQLFRQSIESIKKDLVRAKYNPRTMGIHEGLL